MASLLEMIANPPAMDVDVDRRKANAAIARSQAEIPFVQAQTQHQAALAEQEKIKTQIAQQSLKDAEIMRQMWADHMPGPAPTSPDGSTPQAAQKPSMFDDPVNWAMEGARRGMSAAGVQGLMKHGIETKKSILALGPEARAAEVAALGPVRDALSGYMNTPAGPNQEQAYAQAYQRIQQTDPKIAEMMPAPGAGVAPKASDLFHVMGIANGLSQYLGEQKTGAEIAHLGAQTSQAEAEAAAKKQSTAEAAAQIERESAARQSPEDTAAQQAAMTAQQRSEADIKKAELERQTRMLEETVAQHKAENTLRGRQIDIEGSRNQREQAIYDQTYGAGANEALVGVEPKLRTQAVSAAQKAADEYNKGVSASQDIATLISEARKGNKAAYANIPIEGVLQITTSRGTTRINRQELDAYAGAGSLYDKLAGKLGKWTSGASIPSDVLKDMEDMHKAFADNSAQNYDRKLASINQNYHSNFKPVGNTAKADTGAGLSTGHKVGDVVNVGGKKIKITKVLPNDKFEGDEVK